MIIAVCALIAWVCCYTSIAVVPSCKEKKKIHIVFSTLTVVSFIFQRHQEYWSTTAWSHEEDSIQHPGFERRDQLPQRVCCVIQAFLQIKVHWPTMPFHSWTRRTRGRAVKLSRVSLSCGAVWRDWQGPSEPLRKDWDQKHFVLYGERR